MSSADYLRDRGDLGPVFVLWYIEKSAVTSSMLDASMRCVWQVPPVKLAMFALCIQKISLLAPVKMVLLPCGGCIAIDSLYRYMETDSTYIQCLKEFG